MALLALLIQIVVGIEFDALSLQAIEGKQLKVQVALPIEPVIVLLALVFNTNVFDSRNARIGGVKWNALVVRQVVVFQTLLATENRLVLFAELDFFLHRQTRIDFPDQKSSLFTRHTNFPVILVINGAIFDLVVSANTSVGQIEQGLRTLFAERALVPDAIRDVSIDTT